MNNKTLKTFVTEEKKKNIVKTATCIIPRTLFLEFKYGTTTNKIYLHKVHERMIVSLIF